MRNFNEGDTVRLLSGGPAMTISKTYCDEDGNTAECAWFDKNNNYLCQDFNDKSLEAASVQIKKEAKRKAIELEKTEEFLNRR